MLSRKLAIVALSLCATSVMATPFDGFYAGAGLGGSESNFDMKQTFNLNPAVGGSQIFNITGTNNSDATDNSWLGNINIGYGHVFNQKFFLGVEADANFQNLETDVNRSIQESQSVLSIQAKSRTKLHNALSLTLDPGFVFHQNTLFYGKIGPAWGDFSTKSSVAYSQTINPGTTLTANPSASDSGYESGLLLGLGMEHYVSKALSLKLEYTHINYGGIDTGNSAPEPITVNTAGVPVSGALTETTSLDASTNQVLLGLTYHFA